MSGDTSYWTIGAYDRADGQTHYVLNRWNDGQRIESYRPMTFHELSVALAAINVALAPPRHLERLEIPAAQIRSEPDHHRASLRDKTAGLLDKVLHPGFLTGGVRSALQRLCQILVLGFSLFGLYQFLFGGVKVPNTTPGSTTRAQEISTVNLGHSLSPANPFTLNSDVL